MDRGGRQVLTVAGPILAVSASVTLVASTLGAFASSSGSDFIVPPSGSAGPGLALLAISLLSIHARIRESHMRRLATATLDELMPTQD
jgi:hypothetical protein